jgi:spermidine/putrescine ABC transporter ATP-binding subunit
MRRGEVVSLLGPSGCGKTTTLRMLAGLVEPSEGEIFVRGAPITRVPVHRRNVGMLFQNYALFPHMTVLDNVGFGLRMRRLPRGEVGRRARAALDLVRLTGFEDRYPHQLSGGQQQRVGLARALAIEPAVLLLDEPFGALDKKLREAMQIELRQLQRRLGVTTLMVTHDQEEALTLSDRVAIMRDGVIEQIGPPAEIYEQPASRFVADFVGVSNFLSGRVLGRDGDDAIVETGGGLRLAVRAARPPDAARVTVALRPESIALSAAIEEGLNRVAATIEQVVYRGLVSHYYLALADGRALVAFIQNGGDAPGDAFRPGMRVTASWRPERLRLVADA